MKFLKLFAALLIFSAPCFNAQTKSINLSNKGQFNFVMTFPQSPIIPWGYQTSSNGNGYKLSYNSADDKRLTEIILSTTKMSKEQVMKVHLKGKMMPAFSSSSSAKFKYLKTILESDKGGILVTKDGNHYPYYYFNEGGVNYSFSVYHHPTNKLEKSDAEAILKVFTSVDKDLSSSNTSMADWRTSYKEDRRVAAIPYQRHSSEPDGGKPVFKNTGYTDLDLSYFKGDQAMFPMKIKYVPVFTQKMKQGDTKMEIILPYPFPGQGVIEQNDDMTLEKVKDDILRNKFSGITFKHFLLAEEDGFIVCGTDGKYFPFRWKTIAGKNYFMYFNMSSMGKMNRDQAYAMNAFFRNVREVECAVSSDGQRRVLDLTQRTWLRKFSFPLKIEVPKSTEHATTATGAGQDCWIKLGKDQNEQMQVWRTVGLNAGTIKMMMKKGREYQYSSFSIDEPSGGVLKSKKHGFIPFFHITDGKFDYVVHYPHFRTTPLTEDQAKAMYGYMKTTSINDETKVSCLDDANTIFGPGASLCAFYNPSYNMDIWNPFTVDLSAPGSISGGDIRWNQYSIQIIQGSRSTKPLEGEVSVAKGSMLGDPYVKSVVQEDSTSFILQHIDGSYSAYMMHRINGKGYIFKTGYSPFLYSRKEIDVIYNTMKSAVYSADNPSANK